MAIGDKSEYSRDHEPLKGQDNANHREMWRDFERRRWLREKVDIWFKTFIAIPTAILSLYGVWQMWRGGK